MLGLDLDLDLFSERGELRDGARALESAASTLGAEVQALTRSPDFSRLLVVRSTDSVVVDSCAIVPHSSVRRSSWTVCGSILRRRAAPT